MYMLVLLVDVFLEHVDCCLDPALPDYLQDIPGTLPKNRCAFLTVTAFFINTVLLCAFFLTFFGAVDGLIYI